MQASTEAAPSMETQESVDRRLYRSKDRVIAGVAGGLGEYLGVDPVWLRIGFVLLTLGGGSGFLIYLAMWLIVPERPEGTVVPVVPRGSLTGAAVVGVVLIAIGSISLVNTVAPWLGQFVWPAVLIAFGAALVMGGMRNDARR